MRPSNFSWAKSHAATCKENTGHRIGRSHWCWRKQGNFTRARHRLGDPTSLIALPRASGGPFRESSFVANSQSRFHAFRYDVGPLHLRPNQPRKKPACNHVRDRCEGIPTSSSAIDKIVQALRSYSPLGIMLYNPTEIRHGQNSASHSC